MDIEIWQDQPMLIGWYLGLFPCWLVAGCEFGPRFLVTPKSLAGPLCIQQCRVLFDKNMCSPYANFLVSKGVKKSPPKEQKNVDVSQNKCTYNPLRREFCPVVFLPGCTLGVCLTHINLQKLKKQSPYKILSLWENNTQGHRLGC